jgi:hypothetical protein
VYCCSANYWHHLAFFISIHSVKTITECSASPAFIIKGWSCTLKRGVRHTPKVNKLVFPKIKSPVEHNHNDHHLCDNEHNSCLYRILLLIQGICLYLANRQWSKFVKFREITLEISYTFPFRNLVHCTRSITEYSI